MTIEITVPALGESISEATIAKWHKKQGDTVKVDEILLELETEKVTLEVNAAASGVLEQIFKKEGEAVTVGEIVGKINDTATAAVSATTTSNNPVSNSTAQTANIPTANPEAIATKSLIDSSNTLPPSVKKLVAENNLDPKSISGSGKNGRIIKGDVLEVLTQKDNVAQTSANKVVASPNDKRVERVRMSRLRKTIAERLKDSQNTAAILTTFNEIDMTNVIATRQKYREIFEKKYGIKLGFMSFFVKAAVNALQEIPSVNAEIDGDDIVYKHYYDIGVAVGTEQGLVVPIVRDADKLSFAGIEKEIVNLSQLARTGKLSMAQLSGGTFSISNGGVYGSLMSTPIINPPQSGILGLHKTQERAVVIDSKIEVRSMMYIALSYDHRIIDGKEAVTFLVRIKEAIENPERLLLGV